MIEIMNLRNDELCEPFDFRVDRTSILGAPFGITESVSRDEVCDIYEAWFQEKLVLSKPNYFINQLNNMLACYLHYGRLRLFCWCAPLRCHAETIRDYLLKEAAKAKHLRQP